MKTTVSVRAQSLQYGEACQIPLLLLIATQFTFVLGILPADINLALRAAFLGSFAFCLHLCKKSFQEEI